MCIIEIKSHNMPASEAGKHVLCWVNEGRKKWSDFLQMGSVAKIERRTQKTQSIFLLLSSDFLNILSRHGRTDSDQTRADPDHCPKPK